MRGKSKTNQKTKSRTMNKRKTMKSRTMNNKRGDKKSAIVKIFLEMLTTIKLYHWKTRSFAQHKATDELYGRLNEHIDKFVEILLGKDESRIRMVATFNPLRDYENAANFKEKIYEYREFLVNLTKSFNVKTDTDLLNVRDEILGDINQFLYLMTFDK
jgi:DNA-binding ferritin-like protein